MVSTDIIESVLRKMQSSARMPKFLNKPEYKDQQEKYVERNKQIFLSSAWFKAHESWDRVVSYQESMTDGKSYFVCSLPYQISIKEALLNREEVQDEMSEKTFNAIKFEMEMHALFWGSNLNSFFTFEEIEKNRKISKVYYPKDVSELINDKNLVIPKREQGELRVVSADIATMAGSENDASVFTVGRLIPTKDGYDRQIVYIESMEGGHTTAQSMRIRQLFEDYDATHVVLDTSNAGIGIYDQLTEHATDPHRGTEYSPMSCMNDERLAERCAFPNAPKVIFSIRASGQLNSDIASNFKDSLRRGRIKFPVIEGEADDILNALKGYSNLQPDIKMQLILPYIQTTLMTNEILNLEFDINDSGVIRLKETKGNRKDRYSSVSYLDHFATVMGLKNRKKKPSTASTMKMFMMKPPSAY